ncbi:MAG: hypothetical protein H0U79_08315 [Solirubrobacterales bacterium]|nr:hypothetical protein [Solirubrobacterales bacterium]
MPLTDDTDELRAILDRLFEDLEEARAAVALIDDGDATALTELDRLADALATQVATLKSLTATGRLG